MNEAILRIEFSTVERMKKGAYLMRKSDIKCKQIGVLEFASPDDAVRAMAFWKKNNFKR